MPDDQGSNPGTGELSDSDAIAALIKLGDAGAAQPPPAQDEPDDADGAAEAPATEEAAEADEAEAGSDEPEEQDAEESDADTDKTYPVKVYGKVHQVTLPELIAGYSREQDYRRKTQQVALRQSEAKAAQQQANELAQQLQQRLQTFQGDDADPDDGADWVALSKEDPAGTNTRFFEYNARRQAREQRANERQQAVREQEQQAYRRHLEESAPQMADEFPDWTRDPAKFQREYPVLQKFAIEHGGVTPQQLPWLKPKSWSVMRDAMERRSQKKAAVSAAPLKEKPKPSVVQKPGAVATKSERKAEEARAVVKRAVGAKATQDDALAALAALGVR